MTTLPKPHTPSDLKWLLNERASLLGAAQALQRRAELAEAKLEKLQQQVEVVQGNLQSTRVALARVNSNTESLEVAISLAYKNANPDAAGPVTAWAGRYGERGALTTFVEKTLNAAAPKALTMTVLVDMAAQNFGQQFHNPKERRSFRKSVRSALHALTIRGAIEAMHDGSSGIHQRGISA